MHTSSSIVNPHMILPCTGADRGSDVDVDKKCKARLGICGVSPTRKRRCVAPLAAAVPAKAGSGLAVAASRCYPTQPTSTVRGGKEAGPGHRLPAEKRVRPAMSLPRYFERLPCVRCLVRFGRTLVQRSAFGDRLGSFVSLRASPAARPFFVRRDRKYVWGLFQQGDTK
jgi:hypothetical protein